MKPVTVVHFFARSGCNLQVCFQPLKAKITQSSEKDGAQTAQLWFQDEDRAGWWAGC